VRATGGECAPRLVEQVQRQRDGERQSANERMSTGVSANTPTTRLGDVTSPSSDVISQNDDVMKSRRRVGPNNAHRRCRCRCASRALAACGQQCTASCCTLTVQAISRSNVAVVVVIVVVIRATVTIAIASRGDGFPISRLFGSSIGRFARIARHTDHLCYPRRCFAATRQVVIPIIIIIIIDIVIVVGTIGSDARARLLPQRRCSCRPGSRHGRRRGSARARSGHFRPGRSRPAARRRVDMGAAGGCAAGLLAASTQGVRFSIGWLVLGSGELISWRIVCGQSVPTATAQTTVHTLLRLGVSRGAVSDLLVRCPWLLVCFRAVGGVAGVLLNLASTGSPTARGGSHVAPGAGSPRHRP
jgi:hypothetical protein